jgi:hypothetical protein
MITYEIKKPAQPTEAGANQGAADPGPAAIEPAQAAPQPKAPRILVVDDEFVQFVYAQLRESEPDIEKVLGDTEGPEVRELLELCANAVDVGLFKADPKAFQAFLASDDFVQQVLLTPWFRDKATPDLIARFSNFFTRADRGAALRKEFDAAFPPPDYEIEFVAQRPGRVEALGYDFLFLDLVLTGSASPVDDLKKYLGELSAEAGDKFMPPIVAMSTAEAELTKHRQEFSKASQISAAGLWILPKSDLASKDFKARGLRVLFEQLMAQRDAARSMRAFVRSWADALSKAVDAAETTLWNLDASAIQRIHFTAIGDNDPFDGHLGDLVSREYLWHVEQDKQVAEKIFELDACLREHLDEKEGMRSRFMSPIVDPEAARAFFSHYVWSGWPSGGPFYGDGVDKPEQRFNATLPFGSVLASNLHADGECLIHVTQQCDLNTSTRAKPDKPEKRSAIFAIAEVHKALPHYLTSFKNEDLVAVGLKTADGQFDLRYAPGRVLAMPIGDFLKHAAAKKLAVVGRLRVDVAAQFAQATANQLTRPAAFKMARESSLAVKAFLFGETIPQKPTPTVYEQSPGKGREVVVGRSLEGLISFPDDDGLRIAVWIERMLIAHCGGKPIDVVKLANQLRLGVKSEDDLLPSLKVDIRFGLINKAFATINNLQTPKAPAVRLVLVADESTKAP